MTPRREVCVLRTGRLMDADLACSTLEEHDVPFHRGMETSGGLTTAMALAPTPGPGTWFTVWVPVEAEPEARERLASLPFDIDRQPEVVDFSSSARARVLSKVWAIAVLSLIAIIFYQQCAGAVGQLFAR